MFGTSGSLGGDTKSSDTNGVVTFTSDPGATSLQVTDRFVNTVTVPIP